MVQVQHLNCKIFTFSWCYEDYIVGFAQICLIIYFLKYLHLHFVPTTFHELCYRNVGHLFLFSLFQVLTMTAGCEEVTICSLKTGVTLVEAIQIQVTQVSKVSQLPVNLSCFHTCLIHMWRVLLELLVNLLFPKLHSVQKGFKAWTAPFKDVDLSYG